MGIRKGKDVAIRWRIFTNGNSEPLEGRQLLLELKSPFGRVFELPFSISEGNVIEAVFRGVDQQNVGFYSLTLWENKGYDGQTAVDAVRAFELVRTTDEENKVGESPDLTTETIDLGTSDITLTGLTVRDLFGGEELSDLTGDEYFAVKVGDELKTISAMTIMQLLGGGSGEGGGGITYIEGDGINIEGRKISVDTEYVATKEDINALNEKIDNFEPSEGDIPDGAITTSKIADGAVTEAKLSQSVKDSINNKADASALGKYATKESVTAKQDTLTVESLPNGNIRIGNLQGQTKDFMPATPSGDPMHYAYESIGAVWNGGADYIIETPWKDLVDSPIKKKQWGIDIVNSDVIKQISYKGNAYDVVRHNGKVVVVSIIEGEKIIDETKVVHLSGHWYIHGIGDITNEDMRHIYSGKTEAIVSGGQSRNKNARILIANRTLDVLMTGAFQQSTCEVIAFNEIRPSSVSINLILQNENLRYVIGNINASNLSASANLGFVDNLRAFKISGISSNKKINYPNISINSLIYAINNADKTKNVTLTLHTSIYTRAIEDADVQAALDSHPNISLESE